MASSISDDDMRLFIAIEIPDEIKRHLREAQKKIRDVGVVAGWTRPEGIHLTLQFLGEVSATKVPALIGAMEGAIQGISNIQLEIAGAGAFPNPRKARVVWVGVRGETDKLSRLQSVMEEALTSLGFKREDRKFTPHLTLGRIKQIGSQEAWQKALYELGDIRFASLDVRGISLMKSDLKPSGAEYTEIGWVELK